MDPKVAYLVLHGFGSYKRDTHGAFRIKRQARDDELWLGKNLSGEWAILQSARINLYTPEDWPNLDTLSWELIYEFVRRENES